jgi:hypothetical protein
VKKYSHLFSDSATGEFIVERLAVSGTIANLTDFGAEQLSCCDVGNIASLILLGLIMILMVCMKEVLALQSVKIEQLRDALFVHIS